MKPLSLAGVAVAAAVAALAAQGADSRVQVQTFRTDTHAVLIYASVADKTGHLVQDLTRENFEVDDNGKRQVLTAFTTERQPITVVLMLDRSGSGPRTLKVEREAALEFLHGLAPADRVRIGTFATATKIEPASFTTDHEEMARILEAQTVEAGPTPLWNAASAAIDVLSHEEGRRLLVIFTDGHDSPNVAPENMTLPSLRARAEDEGVMVYSVGLLFKCAEDPGVTTPAPSSFWSRLVAWPLARPDVLAQRGGGRGGGGRGGGGGGRGGRGGGGGGGGEGAPCKAANGTKPDPGLKDLAVDGGGVYTELHGTEDLGATFGHLADDLHRQYLLAFTPAVLDEKEHAIKIKIQPRSDLIVRARTHYFAGADAAGK
jgi:VWFA-related protein